MLGGTFGVCDMINPCTTDVYFEMLRVQIMLQIAITITGVHICMRSYRKLRTLKHKHVQIQLGRQCLDKIMKHG